MEEKQKQTSDEFLERMATHALQDYKNGKDTLEEAVQTIKICVAVYMLMVGTEHNAEENAKNRPTNFIY